MDALGQARKQLAALQSQRAAAEQRVVDLATARELVAYDAATGDRAARRTLDELTRESVTAGLVVDNVDHAIAEARRRLAAAEAAAGRAADRQRAHEARRLLTELRQAGGEAAAALDRFVAELGRFEGVANKLGRLNIGAARHDLVRVNLRRSVQSELFKVGLGQMLSPAERISLADLIDGWTARVETGIGRLLDEPPTEEAA
jgi:hypothetical protein